MLIFDKNSNNLLLKTVYFKINILTSFITKFLNKLVFVY